MVIYILIFIFQLGVKALGDWWYKTRKKKIINHGLSSGIDLLIYIISGYFFLCVPFCTVIFMIGVLGTTLSFRWILYDLIYNWINCEKWNHYGNSSKIDRLMIKSGSYHFIIKLITLFIGINLIVWS